jgi:hypothetical protein
MEKQFQHARWMTCLLVAILVGQTACKQPKGKVSTQDTATTTTYDPSKLPKMWMPDVDSKRDEDNYTGIVGTLSTQLGQDETDSIFYPLSEFMAMIDTFRTMSNIAYLDICPAANPATKKLSVLYMPMDNNCKVFGYFKLPENVPTFSQAANGLTLSQFQDWVDAYSGTAVKWMRPQLDPNDSANYIDRNTRTPMYNTLHLTHYFGDLTELYDELVYQKKNNPLSGVEAFFSLKPTKNRGTQDGYSNRLYLILEFSTDDATSGTVKHKKFYINTNGRTIQTIVYPPSNACSADVSIFGANNGQLCPPACNP